jgi:hypothetical protein
MSFDARIQEALRSPDPFQDLRLLVQSMQAQRLDQATILHWFEQTRQQLRRDGRDKEEDVLMEVMDCLVGWCSPHMNLEPGKQP